MYIVSTSEIIADWIAAITGAAVVAPNATSQD
eukprot:COSAG02_NODE_106_length_36326_cov_13.777266_1_plen_32_part_00